MEFINEVGQASLDEPKKDVSVGILHEIHEICDEFAIHVHHDEDDTHAYLLVQFGVGGPA